MQHNKYHEEIVSFFLKLLWKQKLYCGCISANLGNVTTALIV